MAKAKEMEEPATTKKATVSSNDRSKYVEEDVAPAKSRNNARNTRRKGRNQ